MHISARADYAVRAALALAAVDGRDELVTGERLAAEQRLPRKFLESILGELRRAGLVQSQRGPDGGYRLARPADQVSVADVIRAIDGPLAEVRGLFPESAIYQGAAEHLQEVWIAVRASLRSVLETVTLRQVVTGTLPARVRRLTSPPEAWRHR